jgi:hypothetical protein
MIRAAVVVCALVVALPARGDGNRRAIVVPTQLGGFIPNRQEMRAALAVLVSNRLRRVRVDVEAPALTAAEKQCQEEACLAEIARRHQVDVVVASRLINDEQRADNAYHIAVRVFVRDETPALRAREQVCALCSEDKASELLAMTVAAAYADEPEPVPATTTTTATAAAPDSAPPPVAPSVAVAEPAPPLAPAPRRSTVPWLLGGGAIGLGAGGIVALALGGWKASQDGELRCDPDCRRRDTSAGQAAAFTVGSVAMAGAVTLAVLAWRRTGNR